MTQKRWIDDLDSNLGASSHQKFEAPAHMSTSMSNQGSSVGLRKLTVVIQDRQHGLPLSAQNLKESKGQALHSQTEIEAEQQLDQYYSPYTEVLAVVRSTDDPTIPVNTFRVWFLGSVLSILGTGINEFFGSRYPGIFITTSVAQLLSFPCGVAMARYLPRRRFALGRWSMTLNPGPFNQKEHILISVMANVAFGNGTAYATSIFVMLKLDMFFGERILSNSIGFRIMLTLSTQLLGYACAGIARRFLVYPPAMIWPNSLAQIALNRALHNDNGTLQVQGWRIGRRKFFAYCFTGMLIYFWLPNYLFQALSFFNWTTWIAPDNVILAIITGSLCGLGLNPWPTFDWNVVSSIMDPIMTPFISTANATFGLCISAFFIAPLLYWNNALNTAYLPVSSYYTFDNIGAIFNVSRVLNSDYTLNMAEYDTYSAPYLSAGYVIFLTASFAAIPATISYVLLHHWTELKTGMSAWIKRQHPREAHKDVHNNLMKSYPEVPEWWFGVILLISFVLGCLACSLYPTGFPIWALIFVIAFCIVLQIPLGIIYAVTNIQLYTNVLTEFIAGYALPDRPIANMIFKAFGTNVCSQSLSFSLDLKLGHYLKVPPRTMFAAQVYATTLAAFVAIGVNSWQMGNIKDLCQPTQEDNFTCPWANIFFSSAVIWGVVGPKRLFGPGGTYNNLQWAFLVGAILPLPSWFITRRYPKSFVRFIHIPVILFGCMALVPYNFSFIWPAFIFGFIFNFYIKRRHLAWWQKYAYVLTTSFRGAIAIAAIIIFLTVQLREAPVKWWGNDVSFAGVDGGGEDAPRCVLRTLTGDERMAGS
ncbi:hypothetical protein LTR84_009695 [Exophiala bonariae]|uniref:OPT family small oligopeptide transporter n=1 Tax=Exophiala bonariae TaxID=1690606 RepID=A0AAV9NJ11_9EURO|nr:hypothetical protein LTR84_009695 [Exophiala bonariae]